MRRYIIIVSIGDRKVIRLVESPLVDENNMWDVSANLSTRWLASSAEYPSPEYDIITGAWDSVRAVQGTVGHSWNWESAKIVPLSSSA